MSVITLLHFLINNHIGEEGANNAKRIFLRRLQSNAGFIIIFLHDCVNLLAPEKNYIA